MMLALTVSQFYIFSTSDFFSTLLSRKQLRILSMVGMNWVPTRETDTYNQMGRLPSGLLLTFSETTERGLLWRNSYLLTVLFCIC